MGSNKITPYTYYDVCDIYVNSKFVNLFITF